MTQYQVICGNMDWFTPATTRLLQQLGLTTIAISPRRSTAERQKSLCTCLRTMNQFVNISPTEELYSERNAQLGGLSVLGGKHDRH